VALFLSRTPQRNRTGLRCASPGMAACKGLLRVCCRYRTVATAGTLCKDISLSTAVLTRWLPLHRVTVSQGNGSQFQVNIKGTTHIGTTARIFGALHPHETLHLLAGAWEADSRAARDLFVSGSAHIGRNITGESHSLSVHGLVSVRIPLRLVSSGI